MKHHQTQSLTTARSRRRSDPEADAVDLAVIDMPCYSKLRAIAVPDPHFHPDDAGDIIQRFSKLFPPNCMIRSEMLLNELGKTLGVSKHALASCVLRNGHYRQQSGNENLDENNNPRFDSELYVLSAACRSA
jgi:hypothetical protein